MPIPITIPRLGWNMESGTFIEWLKLDGDAVKPGDRLYRLEGEKSVEEIEAFDAGVLSIPATAPRPGDTVAVGAELAMLLQPGESPASIASPKVEPAASPSLRRLAREKGIDLAVVAGSGPGGRITERDLAADARRDEPRGSLREKAGSFKASPRARRLAKQRGIDLNTLHGSGATGRIRDRDVPLVEPGASAPGVSRTNRSVIANRMMASRANTAPVTLTTVVDCVNLVNLREQFKAVESPVPSFNDFFLKLAAAALQQHPQLAAQWSDAGLVQPRDTNIGFAVDTDAGLLVPVIRDEPSLGLRQIAAQSRELIEKARRGALASREMSEGCFTITNLGSFGIDVFTPIINLPECSILGIGRIERRPVADGDRVAIREQVWLSLTFDHRVVDGAPAARFLQTLSKLIANPGPAIL